MYILIPAGQIPTTPISYMPAPEALHGDFTIGEMRSSEYWAAQTFCLQQGPKNWHLQGKRSCGVSQSVCLFFFEKFRSFVLLKTFLESVPSILKYDIPVGCPQFEGWLIDYCYMIGYPISLYRLVVLSFSPMDDDNPQKFPSESSHLVQQSAVVLQKLVMSWSKATLGAPDTNGYVHTETLQSKNGRFKNLDPSHPEKCKIEYIYIHKFELNRCLKYEFHANSVSKLGVSTSKWIRCPTRPAGPSGDGSKFEAQEMNIGRKSQGKSQQNGGFNMFQLSKKASMNGVIGRKENDQQIGGPLSSAILLEVMALPVKVCLEVPFHRGKHPRGPWPP